MYFSNTWFKSMLNIVHVDCWHVNFATRKVVGLRSRISCDDVTFGLTAICTFSTSELNYNTSHLELLQYWVNVEIKKTNSLNLKQPFANEY